ncbi:Nephrocystin-3 [Stylophora pistillata]|uniref:Nephrocystin-3 n=1 Tax=Stylophora pistillata TaxID=50429 RepID=A0A2B4S460_STYPI|nr:Nephrocystin-3 [Stylophora pistillata]
MATALEYSAEQINCYRICYVATDVLTEDLRIIFKREWNSRFKTTLGEWKDKPNNGLDFWNGESPRNRSRNKDKELLQTEEQRQALEQQLHTSVLPFCILPPKPANDVSDRESEVNEIDQKLKALKSSNDDGLSTLYLSGNPESGKSQLASLVAKTCYDAAKEIPSVTSFVITLNAENSETLLESYISFAGHCKSLEYAVTNTLNSTERSTGEKITGLKNVDNWGDCVEKLAGGQRATTETILSKTNPSYHKSMTTAITLAVKEAITTDEVINHLFTFLPLCSPQPILQDIAINYIMEMDEKFKDKEWISSRINRCSRLLIEEEEGGVYIRVHGVVRYVLDSLKTYCVKDMEIKTVFGVVESFVSFDDLDSFIIGTKIVPHLREFIINAKYLLANEDISQVGKIGVISLQGYLNGCETLGIMCLDHCEYQTAIKYYEEALDIPLKEFGPEYVDVAVSYGNLSSVYRDLGDFDRANDYHARALDILLKQLVPEHVHVATSHNNLGPVYSDLGDFYQAKDYQSRALDT